MRTASEVKAEDVARKEAQRQARATKVTAYLAGLPPLEQGGHPSRAEKLREMVREGHLHFSDVACDHCGTELFHSGMVNLSSPPTQWHDCPGCGERHLLPA